MAGSYNKIRDFPTTTPDERHTKKWPPAKTPLT